MNAQNNESREITIPTVEQTSNFLLEKGSFDQAYRAGKMMSQSDMVPDQYKGNIQNCMVAILNAHQLGVNPFMYMQNSYPIHGKIGIESKLAIGLANNSGRFKGCIKYKMSGEGMTRKCIAWAIDKEDGEKCEAECTMEIAKKEKWLEKKGSKWQTMPDLMLKYRSAMFFIRLYAPDCLMGMQSIDEIKDFSQKEIKNINQKAEIADPPEEPIVYNGLSTVEEYNLRLLSLEDEKRFKFFGGQAEDPFPIEDLAEEDQPERLSKLIEFMEK